MKPVEIAVAQNMAFSLELAKAPKDVIESKVKQAPSGRCLAHVEPSQSRVHQFVGFH